MTARALILAIVLCAGNALAARYAVVIGANNGDHSDVGLRYAETDARRVAATLRSVGGFDASNVIELVDTDATTVRRTLIDINARIRQDPGESLLWVYYSGHADNDSLHLNGTRLALDELRALVTGSPATARVLAVDACRSGALTRAKGGTRTGGFAIAVSPDAIAQGTAILTSSTASEDSQESDAIGASFFTHHLVSGMLGAADVDLDGTVTLGEAFDYAAQRTLASTTSSSAGPQHPSYRLDLGGRGDLVLTRPGMLARGQGAIEFAQPGWYLVHRGNSAGVVVAEVFADRGGRRLTLPAESFHVVAREPSYLREGDVEIRVGQVTRVDTQALHIVDYARVVRKGGTTRTRAYSAFAVGSVRGDVLDLGMSIGSELGLRLDAEAISLEARLGLGFANQDNERNAIVTRETTASIGAVRAVDLGPLTLAGGVAIGAAWFAQGFAGPMPTGIAPTPSRNAFAGFVAPRLTVQAPLGSRLYLRLDGAIPTYVLRAGNGPGPSTTQAASTYQVQLGLGGYL